MFDRRSVLAYRLLACMMLSVAALVAVSSFGVDRRDLPIMAGLILYLVAIGMVLRRLNFRRGAAAIEAAALIVASTILICCLSTLLAISAFDYRDAVFDRVDGLLFPGFSWLDMFHAVRPHPTLVAAMSLIYSSLLWQPFALIAALALAGREDHVWQFLHAWLFSLIACVAVFAFMPAVGAYSFHHLVPADIPAMGLRVGWDQQAVLEAIRSGQLRSLTPSRMTGIVAFPSFHAAAGTLLAWSFRRLPLIGPPLVLWNLAMIASAPLIGSHYFCDILAGMAVAVLAIIASETEAKRLR